MEGSACKSIYLPLSPGLQEGRVGFLRQGLLWAPISQAGLGLNVSKGDLDLDSPASTS